MVSSSQTESTSTWLRTSAIELAFNLLLASFFYKKVKVDVNFRGLAITTWLGLRVKEGTELVGLISD
jgi:hypothetical protein